MNMTEMNLQIKVRHLITAFTATGLLFFCGFLNFVFRIISPSNGNIDNLISDTAGNPVNKLIGSVIFLIVLILSIYYKKILKPEFILRNKWVYLFASYILLSIFWSVDPGTTIRRTIFLLTVLFFAIYLAYIYDVRKLFTLVGYTISLCALVGLIWAIISPDQAFVAGGIREGAFLGIFVEKNGGARAYVLAVLLLLPQFIGGDRKAICATAICILCILLAKSASAILLLIFGITTTFYLDKLTGSGLPQINKFRYISGLFIFFIFLFITFQAYEFILSLVGRDPSLTNRTVIWQLLEPLIYEKLNTGYGYGAFWAGFGADEFIDRWGYIGNAHNGYLEILLHGGLPLLTIFSILIISTLFKLINLASVHKSAREYNVCIAILFVLIVSNFIAYSLPNHNSIDFFIFSLIVAITMSSMNLVGSVSTNSRNA